MPILYISYDGLTDPLGRSQVLPYLIGLSAKGHRFTILSCEKPARMAAEGETVRRICEEAGIEWAPLRYHKQPPVLSGLWDSMMMERAAIRLHQRTPFDIVHCRSYLPAAAGLALKRRFGVRFLFDMRGYWPEEKVEAGSWPQSNPLFRAVYGHMKRLETKLLAGADHIVTLTRISEPQLRERPALRGRDAPIATIPCCADFDHFPLITPQARAAARSALGIAQDTPLLAYLGSIGAWYMLDEMLDFFAAYRARHPAARLLFVTHQSRDSLEAAAAARGIDPDRIVVRPASREQVPQLMAAADAGLFFIKPVPSKMASSPTKMAEMMAMGLPIVTNGGVGDVAEIVAESGCGVVVDRFDRGAYEAAVARLERLHTSPERIRAAGLRRFDAAEGIARYDAVYRALLEPAGMDRPAGER